LGGGGGGGGGGFWGVGGGFFAPERKKKRKKFLVSPNQRKTSPLAVTALEKQIPTILLFTGAGGGKGEGGGEEKEALPEEAKTHFSHKKELSRWGEIEGGPWVGKNFERKKGVQS